MSQSSNKRQTVCFTLTPSTLETQFIVTHSNHTYFESSHFPSYSLNYIFILSLRHFNFLDFSIYFGPCCSSSSPFSVFWTLPRHVSTSNALWLDRLSQRKHRRTTSALWCGCTWHNPQPKTVSWNCLTILTNRGNHRLDLHI